MAAITFTTKTKEAFLRKQDFLNSMLFRLDNSELTNWKRLWLNRLEYIS